MSNSAIDLMIEELDKKSILLKELIEFKSKLENVIKEMQKDWINELNEMAKENGLLLDELSEELIKLNTDTKKQKEPKQIQYRNPDNHEETWVGCGKRPDWYKERLNNKQPIDKLY